MLKGGVKMKLTLGDDEPRQESRVVNQVQLHLPLQVSPPKLCLVKRIVHFDCLQIPAYYNLEIE